MKTAGIIAEYNPFHNGHRHQIEVTRQMGVTHIVCVLGGNYTQRGEVSVVSKIAKAKTALANGVDLVLELPHPFSVAAAPDFALGGVQILNALGCVDMLSFGSECGIIEELLNTVDALNQTEGGLFQGMEDGKGFPAAKQALLSEKGYQKEAEILSCPNNILGVEYISALKKINSRITPFTVPRKGANHGDNTLNDRDFASGTALRNIIMIDLQNAFKYMPSSAFEVLSAEAQKGRLPLNSHNLDIAIMSRLRMIDLEQLENIMGIAEGLHNRIYKEIRKCQTTEEIVKNVTTKRYTSSRIRRILISAATGVTKDLLKDKKIPYIRVLGQNEKGNEILKIARQTATLPIIQKPTEIDGLNSGAKAFFKTECNATDLYAMGFKEMGNCGLEYTENIYSE